MTLCLVKLIHKKCISYSGQTSYEARPGMATGLAQVEGAWLDEIDNYLLKNLTEIISFFTTGHIDYLARHEARTYFKQRYKV